MSLLHRCRTGIVLLSLAGATACESSTAPLVLTEEEAADAFDALEAIGLGLDFFVAGEGGSAADATLRAKAFVANLVTAIDETGPCPNGGNVHISGTVDETETTLAVDLTQDYASCASTSSTNRLWTFDGDPNIRTILNLTETAFSGSIKGGIAFSSEGTTGTCVINISIGVNGIKGKVCGRTIDEPFAG